MCFGGSVWPTPTRPTGLILISLNTDAILALLRKIAYQEGMLAHRTLLTNRRCRTLALGVFWLA